MKGLLLVNLGTPDAPDPPSVRRFLRELLSDPKVVDLPWPVRKLLLELVILPLRAKRSARAYRRVWTERGSPLLVHGRDLAREVSERLGQELEVALAMRYGSPSIEAAMDTLEAAGVETVRLLPLYPQEAASTRGSTIEAVQEAARERTMAVEVLPPFFEHPGFIQAMAEVAAPVMRDLDPEHVLFSFHGLPERQVRAADPTGRHCLVKEACCEQADEAPPRCYRFQCHRTARALASALGLGGEPGRWSLAFQSRMGRVPWIGPHTDEVLSNLARGGTRRVAVMCPSFVADCLETLEEIGMEAKESFESQGGERLALVPCVNDSPVWADTVAGMALGDEVRPWRG